MRIGSQVWSFLNGRRFVDPQTFDIVWTFGAFLLPLAILEIYLQTERRGGSRGRLTMATALAVLTIAMSIGIVRAVTRMWIPHM